MFHLLKFTQNQTTTADTIATGLGNAIDEPFAHNLRRADLNLDRNPRTKKAAIDFLNYLHEILEQTMTQSHLQNSFVEAGVIDNDTNLFPTFNGLMATCKR